MHFRFILILIAGIHTKDAIKVTQIARPNYSPDLVHVSATRNVVTSSVVSA